MENTSEALDRDPIATVLMRFITHIDVALSRASIYDVPPIFVKHSRAIQSN